MEANGAGLRRAASNDGKSGEWDGTALEEGGRLGKKLTEWRREKSEEKGVKRRWLRETWKSVEEGR
jgi:hypothetical protein